MFTVCAQAQSTYDPTSAYSSAGAGNMAYTSGNTTDPYQNQGLTGTNPYGVYQNQSTNGTVSYDPYQTQNANAYSGNNGTVNSQAGLQNNNATYADPYGTSVNPAAGSTAAGTYDPYSVTNTNQAGTYPYGSASSPTDTGMANTAVPYNVTPSPIPVDGTGLYGTGNATVAQPGVTPSPLPLSSLSESATSTTVPVNDTSVEDDLLDLADAEMEDVGEPLYESTKQYMEKLSASGYACAYRGTQGPSTESVFSSFSGNNVTLNTMAIFSDTGTDCILYVLKFVDFNGKNTDLVSPLLDALNSEYRFAKFSSAPNGTVSVSLDLLFTADNAGEICYDGLRRLLNVCDECYEALYTSVEALPDEGQGISMWDDSDLNGSDSVSASYGMTTPAPTAGVPAATEPVQTTQGGRSVIMKVKIRNGGSLNVRMQPDQNSILVGTAEGGKTYDCLSVADNGWYEIVLPNGMTGFISGKRVTEVK